MKNWLIIILAFILVVSCKNKTIRGENGVTYSSAIEYNDYIVSRQTTLLRNIMSFVAVAQSDMDSAELLLNEYVISTAQMVKEIKGMPAFKGDSSLRNAAVNTFSFYGRIFDNDYRNIIKIRQGSDGTSAEADSKIEAIVKKIAQEEKGLDQAFQASQRTFAEKNNIILVENQEQKELKDQMDTDR